MSVKVSVCLKRFGSQKSNFTIDHILNVAGTQDGLNRGRTRRDGEKVAEAAEESGKFEWLNCTRYRPPKLPRQRKKDGVQKRKLGRNPRIPFSSSQVAVLESTFLRTPYLSSADVTQLATYLKLTETRVKIWFQNRRAREKRDHEARLQVRREEPERGEPVPPVPFPSSVLSPGRFVHIEPSVCRTDTCVLPLDLSERQLTSRPE